MVYAILSSVQFTTQLVKKMDEGEREREREGRERVARQTGLRRGREKRGLTRCGSDFKKIDEGAK